MGKAMSPWIKHVMAVKKQYKLKSLGEAMKKAKLTYKPSGSSSKSAKQHTKKRKSRKNKSKKNKSKKHKK